MSEIICKKCGAVDCYTTTQRGKHITAFCTSCDAYIKNLPQGKPPVLFFGKYKDREIASLITAEEIRYLQWLTGQSFVKTKLREDIDAHLKTV